MSPPPHDPRTAGLRLATLVASAADLASSIQSTDPRLERLQVLLTMAEECSADLVELASDLAAAPASVSV
jgi:hypothetical protein